MPICRGTGGTMRYIVSNRGVQHRHRPSGKHVCAAQPQPQPDRPNSTATLHTKPLLLKPAIQQCPAVAVSRQRRRRRGRSGAASPCRCRRPQGAPPAHRSPSVAAAAVLCLTADPPFAEELLHPNCPPPPQAAGLAAAPGPALHRAMRRGRLQHQTPAPDWTRNQAATRGRLQRLAPAPAWSPAAGAAARPGRCRRAPAGCRKQFAAGPGRRGRPACRSSQAAARLRGKF